MQSMRFSSAVSLACLKLNRREPASRTSSSIGHASRRHRKVVNLLKEGHVSQATLSPASMSGKEYLRQGPPQSMTLI